MLASLGALLSNHLRKYRQSYDKSKTELKEYIRYGWTMELHAARGYNKRLQLVRDSLVTRSE